MKIRDGFKFGVGFLIAYDLYGSTLIWLNKLNRKLREWNERTNTAYDAQHNTED